MSTWTEKAEQLRITRLATERFLALWAAESLLDAPPAWQRLDQSLQNSAGDADTSSLPADFQPGT